MKKWVFLLISIVALGVMFPGCNAGAKSGTGAELRKVVIDNTDWHAVYKRIDGKRKDAKLSWSKLAKKAGIKVASWMTGLNTSHPTEEEIYKIAAVPEMNTTYAYLRFGIEDTEIEQEDEL